MARRHTRGYIFVATAFSAVFLVGMAGLAVDLGRMYIARTEVQSFVDAAALTATTKLNGDKSGVDAAVASVQAGVTSKLWNLGNDSFLWNNTTVEFSSSTVPGVWTSAANVPVGTPVPPGPTQPVETDRVRVTTWVPVPLSFLRVLVSAESSGVRASATAIRSAVSAFPPNSNVLPLSAVSHKSIGLQIDDPDDPYGLQIGQYYTLHWDQASSHSVTQCPGDGAGVVAYVDEKHGPMDGWQGGVCQGASTCAQELTGNGIAEPVSVGGTIDTKEGVANIGALSDQRVGEDTDTDSLSYFGPGGYLARRTGNGRRVVMAPLNTGAVSGSGSNSFAVVAGFGAFLMMDSDWAGSGNGYHATCGQYLGTVVPGLPFSGGVAPGNNPSVGNPAFAVRLVK